MWTWDDLRRRLTERWRVVTRDPSWCGLLAGPEGHERPVVLEPSGDGRHLLVGAQVCWLAALPAEEALRYNAAAPHGMLMLQGKTYVLRQVFAFDRLDPAALDEAIDAMAAEAARLRQQVAPEPAPIEARQELFACVTA